MAIALGSDTPATRKRVEDGATALQPLLQRLPDPGAGSPEPENQMVHVMVVPRMQVVQTATAWGPQWQVKRVWVERRTTYPVQADIATTTEGVKRRHFAIFSIRVRGRNWHFARHQEHPAQSRPPT